MADKEAKARALAVRIRELADEELVEMARLLVSKPEHEIFIDTEVVRGAHEGRSPEGDCSIDPLFLMLAYDRPTDRR